MSISTTASGPLINIISFLAEPVRGGTKELQFAQLFRDRIFLLKLKQMNLPLFPFLNYLSIPHIKINLGLEAEFDSINDIFMQIHDTAKRSLTPLQFTEICTQHASRCISRYTEMNATNNQNKKDHAICELANALRNSISTIPTEKEAIRVWFADPANELELNTITELEISNKNLQYLPPEIGKLNQLTLLNLSNNNIPEIPAEIGNFANLEFLDLSNNKIPEIPVEIVKLVKLNYLDLSNNKISKLPEEIVRFLSEHNFVISPQKITEADTLVGSPAASSSDLARGGEKKRSRIEKP